MEWQAVVLAVQILMLAVGWFLFQQARGELSARAAEMPILGEVKALQRSIKQLLSDMEQASGRSSEQLEARCSEARRLLSSLEGCMQEFASLSTAVPLSQNLPAAADGGDTMVHNGRNALTAAASPGIAVVASPAAAVSLSPPVFPSGLASGRDLRRENVFTLADSGLESGAIARQTGLSEGEIETLLGLRLRRA